MRFVGFVAIVILTLVPSRAIGVTGGLDPRFGPWDGEYWEGFFFHIDPNDLGEAEDAAMDPWFYTVLAYQVAVHDTMPPFETHYYPALLRLDPNGEPDPLFGTNGVWIETVYETCSTCPVSVAIDPQGRPIVGFSVKWPADGDIDFAIRRVSHLGTSDIAKVTNFFNPNNREQEVVHDLLVWWDGRVIVVGEADFPGSTGDIDFAVAVWQPVLPDGLELDPSFGVAGRKLVAFDIGANKADSAFAVSPHGTGLLLAGQAATGTFPGTSFSTVAMAVARIDLAGNLDSTFGAGGKVTFAHQPIGSNQFFENTARSIVPLAGGGIAVGGYTKAVPTSNARFAVTKISDAGVTDLTWGSVGWWVPNLGHPSTPFVGANAYLSALAAAPDGGVVAAGTVVDPNDTNLARGVLARVSPLGFLDPGFAGTGLRSYALEPSMDPSYPVETRFNHVMLLEGDDFAQVAGRMRCLPFGQTPPIAGTPRCPMAARMSVDPLIFADGFESGDTGEWSAVVP